MSHLLMDMLTYNFLYNIVCSDESYNAFENVIMKFDVCYINK